MVGFPDGGLTRHDGSPVVTTPSESKSMDFENPDGLGISDEKRGAVPAQEQAQMIDSPRGWLAVPVFSRLVLSNLRYQKSRGFQSSDG